MRKMKSLLIFPLSVMGAFLIFSGSCKKIEDKGVPELTTSEVTEITQTSAKCGGNITSEGGAVILSRGVCWSTEQTPTVSDNKTTEGTGSGNFTSIISGLTANTKYYVRAYATNNNGIAYGGSVSFITQQEVSTGSFTDSRDGNVYHTIKIGTQEWMVENLRYLPSVSGPSQLSSTSPKYYVYGYDGENVSDAKSSSNFSTYGVLYNWEASITAAPNGWHVAGDHDWWLLESLLGGESLAGGKLKEIGTTHWTAPNTGATNEKGFTALPGGELEYTGVFSFINSNGAWWSSTQDDLWGRYAWTMSSFDSELRKSYYNTWLVGFSIRCVKD